MQPALYTLMGVIMAAIIAAVTNSYTAFMNGKSEKSKADASTENAQTVQSGVFQANLMNRIAQLEESDKVRTIREVETAKKMSLLELQMEHMRGQVSTLIVRMEAVIASNPVQFAAEWKAIIAEFRTILGLPPSEEHSIMIGDTARHQGD